MKNKFIIFEGIDGSGKTTLINFLKKSLPSEEFFFTKEPCGTIIASSIKNILDEAIKNEDSLSQVLAFALDRSFHIKNIIMPYLNKGFSVISDRFVYSSLAYQGLFCEKNLIRDIFNISSYNIKVDKIFFCDIEPKIALERIRQRHNNDFFDDIYSKKLDELRSAYKDILADENCVVYLDMNNKVEDIAQKVINSIFDKD